MKQRFSFEIRIAAILVLVLVVVIITGLYAYQRFTHIVEKVTEETRPDMSLVIAGGLVSDLVEAENSVKSFSLTQDTSYLFTFYEVVQSAEFKLNDLHQMTQTGTEKYQQILLLDSLVNEKFDLLDDLLHLRDSQNVNQAIDRILLNVNTNVETTTTKATTPKTKIGRFLRGLRRKRDTVITEKIESVELDVLDRQLALAKRTEYLRDSSLRSKELDLIEQDRELTASIKQVIDRMEKNELEAIRSKAERAEMEVGTTNRQIAIFCVFAGLLIIFMAFTIVNYTRNNNKFRKVLNDARREAEELATAKERFVANISHEIRTPMNSIAGFAEQLSRSDLSEKQREQLEMVIKSSDHLLHIINDVLDFTKLQAGKVKLEDVGFKPKEVMEELMNLVKPLAEQKGLELKTQIDQQVPEVLLGDPVRLRQIMLNLLSNAIKFTDKGSVSLEVNQVLSNTETTTLKVVVKDTGIGMKSSEIDKIFDEFEQAEVSTSRNYGGTGLGLSITKKLIELHEGTIDIQSKKGEGTTVVVLLKFDIGDETDAEVAKHRDSTYEIPDGLRILIVDDEEYNRKLLRTILEKHKALITEAVNGKQAVEEAKLHDYDVVLMDARMPEMDGIEATKMLRASGREKLQRLPIIALTAAVSEDDQKRFIDAGMNGFLPKPFKEMQLLEVLETVSHLQVIPESVKSIKKRMEETGALFNLDELRSISGNDDHFFSEMLKTFISTTEEGVEEMTVFLELEDYEKLADVAHKICAPCRHIEAMKLHGYLKLIEKNCRSGEDLDKIGDLVAKVKLASEEVIKGIKKELNQGAKSRKA